jgi:hypothetical protein
MRRRRSGGAVRDHMEIAMTATTLDELAARLVEF